MPDNDDSLASLGRSDVSAVDHSVSPPIPEVFQAQDDCCKVSARVAGEKSVRVLQDGPPWASRVHETEVLVDESVELPVEPGVLSGEAVASTSLTDDEVLAGEAGGDDVRSSKLRASDIVDVLPSWYVGPVLGEHLGGVLVDFDLRGAGHSGEVEPEVEPADSSEQ